MNRFKVKLGCEEDFEKVWRERESKLQNFSGFKEFMLLRVDDGDGSDEEDSPSAKAGFTEFISHTVWSHKLDYDEWRRSQAFKKSHSQGDEGRPPSAGGGGGMSSMAELTVERPTPTTYDAVLIEPTPPEHKGGLWDFENEPSYFDGDLRLD